MVSSWSPLGENTHGLNTYIILKELLLLQFAMDQKLVGGRLYLSNRPSLSQVLQDGFGDGATYITACVCYQPRYSPKHCHTFLWVRRKLTASRRRKRRRKSLTEPNLTQVAAFYRMELFSLKFSASDFKSPSHQSFWRSPVNFWWMSFDSTEVNRIWPNFSLKGALPHHLHPHSHTGELTSGPSGQGTPLTLRYLDDSVFSPL